MRTVLVITLTALASLTARADVAFDTFGPSNAYDYMIGLNVGPALGQGAGAVFIPLITGSLAQIDLALTHVSGHEEVSITLFDLASGDPIELFNSSTPNPFGNPCCPIISVTSVANPFLIAGHSYLLFVGTEFSASLNEWNLNSIGAVGTDYLNGEFVSNHSLPAFRVNVSPASVPEPGSILLLSTIVAGLFVGFRAGRKSPTRSSI